MPLRLLRNKEMMAAISAVCRVIRCYCIRANEGDADAMDTCNKLDAAGREQVLLKPNPNPNPNRNPKQVLVKAIPNPNPNPNPTPGALQGLRGARRRPQGGGDGVPARGARLQPAGRGDIGEI